jgi:predicted regulator of Ras-like GTPase activity (Roadblock/LC7/MglB family)
VDAAQSLSDLAEVSSQIFAAVIVDDKGAVAGSTLPGGDALADAGRTLLAQAAAARDGAEPTQIEAATESGSVFVLRDGGGWTIVATTGPRPTVGLVFYDLKSALRSLEPAPKPKKPRAPRKKKADDAT